MIELATGHGKTPIIACLAKALSEQQPGTKVVVVTMNSYLTHHAYEKFTDKESNVKFPCLNFAEGVMYMTN